MTDSLCNIVRATPGDSDQLLDILAEAFFPDPLIEFIVGEGKSPRSMFGMILPAYLEHEHCFLNEDGSGAMMILPAGKRERLSPALLRLPQYIRDFGWRGLARSVQAASTLKPKHPSHPHYYLMAVGTLERSRGKGVGSALLRTMTEICDEARMPAYLENSKEENIAFYQGHGFELREQIRLGSDGPPVWLMDRKARNPGPNG